MNTNQSMTDFIKESIKDIETEKIIFADHIFSTKQIFSEIACVASFLKENGVSKGDSVLICLPNVVHAIVALYAINCVGAVANIAHPKIGTDALVQMAEETNTKWIFVFDKFFAKHRKKLFEKKINSIVCHASDYLIGNVSINLRKSVAIGKYAVNYNSILVKPHPFDVEIKGEDIAVYLHSSGTTGNSKTVMLSNRAMNELAKSIYNMVQPEDNTTMLMTLPMFHGFGLGVCVHLMMMFGKIALVPVFSAKNVINILKKHNIHYMALVPNMLRKLVADKNFFGKKLRSLKYIFVGGDTLDEVLRKKAQDIVRSSGSDGKICEGFGLSEAASVTHINLKMVGGGTVGQPLDGVKVKIMQEDKQLPPGEDGEIFLTSRALMSGYLDAETKFFVDINGDQWIDTGDVGHVDEDDNLYYRGREKRMLKVGGVNIFPREVENLAKEVSEVKDACAIRTLWKGKPALKLLVKLNPNCNLTLILKEKIKKKISSGLLPYAVPKYMESVKELKMTGLGKTDYRYYEKKINGDKEE